MARRYEGSPEDVAADRREAKKRGMSMKDWEKSDADKKMDAAGAARARGTARPKRITPGKIPGM